MGSFMLGVVHGIGQSYAAKKEQEREMELLAEQERLAAEREDKKAKNTAEIQKAAALQKKIDEKAANIEATKGGLNPYVRDALRSSGMSPKNIDEATEAYFDHYKSFFYDAKGNRNPDITADNIDKYINKSVKAWVNSAGSSYFDPPDQETPTTTPNIKTPSDPNIEPPSVSTSIYTGFSPVEDVTGVQSTELERAVENLGEVHPNLSYSTRTTLAKNIKDLDYLTDEELRKFGINPEDIDDSYRAEDGRVIVVSQITNTEDGSKFKTVIIPGTGIARQGSLARNLAFDEVGDLQDKTNASIAAAQNAISQTRNVLQDPNVATQIGIQGRFFSSLSEAVQAVPGAAEIVEGLTGIDLQAYDASLQELVQQSNESVEAYLNNLKQAFPGTRMSQYLVDRAKEKAVEVNDPTATVGKLLKNAEFITESNMILTGEALYSLGQNKFRGQSEKFRKDKIQRAMYNAYMSMYTRTSNNEAVSYSDKQMEALERQLTKLVDYNYKVIERQRRSFFGD